MMLFKTARIQCTTSHPSQRLLSRLLPGCVKILAACIIDIGCSIGALSVAALFIDSDAEITAIDSNIASLLTT